MSDLKDIWPIEGAPDNKGLPEDKLMAYLEGNLSPEEQHEVEAWLDREGMESDAMEGLQSLSPAETRRMTSRLKQQLMGSLNKKRRRRRGMLDQKWAWFAIVIVLLIAVVCFAVVYLMRKGQ